jgi:hypothetical protein
MGAFFDFLLKRQRTTPEFLNDRPVSPTPSRPDERLIPQEVIRSEVKKHFQRRWVADENDFRRSLGALIGIVQGLLCDGNISDQEIQYLKEWLADNDAISYRWPGDIICASVQSALADGVRYRA